MSGTRNKEDLHQDNFSLFLSTFLTRNTVSLKNVVLLTCGSENTGTKDYFEKHGNKVL